MMVGARTYAGHTALQLGRDQLLAAGYTASPQDDDEELDYYNESEEDSDDDFDQVINCFVYKIGYHCLSF